MKRLRCLLLSGFFILTGVVSCFTLIPLTAQADELNSKPKIVRFKVGQSFYRDGSNPVQMDAKTYMAKGRTFVPVRYLANGLGVDNGNIKFEDSKVTLTKGDRTIGLTIGSSALEIDGTITTYMDVTPQEINGRVYLPARFVSEAFEKKVDWDNNYQTVRVYSEGQPLKPEGVMRIEELTGGKMEAPAGVMTWWAYVQQAPNDNFQDAPSGYNYVENEKDGTELRIVLGTNCTENDMSIARSLLQDYFPNDSRVSDKFIQMTKKKSTSPYYEETVIGTYEGRFVVLSCSKKDVSGAYLFVSKVGLKF